MKQEIKTFRLTIKSTLDFTILSITSFNLPW